ncbi:Uncharacterised protein [Vibrio cholerae]|nr:Uncharacterised protein [Vibrio cholerae]
MLLDIAIHHFHIKARLFMDTGQRADVALQKCNNRIVTSSAKQQVVRAGLHLLHQHLN